MNSDESGSSNGQLRSSCAVSSPKPVTKSGNETKLLEESTVESGDETLAYFIKEEVFDYSETVDENPSKQIVYEQNLESSHAEVPQKKRSFTCCICQKSFNSNAHLTVHVRTHTGEKPFKCSWEDCNKGYVRKSDLTRHLQLHEKNDRLHHEGALVARNLPTGEDVPVIRPAKRVRVVDLTCHVCQKILSDRRTLKEHLIRHSDLRPYKCTLDNCEKTFAAKSDRRLHQRSSAHFNEKKYVCTICDFRCVRSYHLKLHVRTHTGEKPYKCPSESCGMSFARLSTLTCHRAVHTGDKLFPCPVEGCGKNYGYRAARNRHMKKKHG